MTAASVIIVSRHRAQALRRCILALRQQDHTDFEVIVVADPAALSGLDGQDDLKKIAFDEANISAARNLGIAAAAGAHIAFIDDDAAAEATWLTRLIAPFADPAVQSTTGFVRGRNGISFQWQACLVDHLGDDHPLDISGTTVLAGTPKRAVKTQGTNCAFRATTLRAIGGFDPAFRFYLDEADVNLRLAPLGAAAITPLAQVHHGYMASAMRRGDRIPTDLFEIGASSAVFLRRHAGPDDLRPERLIAQQRVRLDLLQTARKLTRHDAARLMETLENGWQDGLARPLRRAAPMDDPAPEFLRFAALGPRGGVVIAGRIWSRKSLIERANIAVSQGYIVTVFCLSPTRRAHWVQFTDAGFWLQTGGIWGRSDRSDPRIIWGNFARRIAREIARIKGFRPV